MRGMFRFGCSSAYGSHSYSANLDSTGLVHSMDPSMRSLVYTQRSQASEPRGAAGSLRTGLQELFPGVRADEWFDVFMLAIAVLMLSSALMIGCFFIAWITGLKGTPINSSVQPIASTYPVSYVTSQPLQVQTVQSGQPVMVQQYEQQQTYPDTLMQSVAPPPAPEYGRPESRPFYGPSSWVIVDH